MPRSDLHRFHRLVFALAVIAAIVVSACRPAFQVRRYQGSNERLYRATLEQYNKRKWDNAVAGFERLSLDLPARDTLLPKVYYYLGRAHMRRGENLLAAQTLNRLTEAFPEDTLADDALFLAGQAYQKMWRKPVLDSQYGQSALSTFRLLLALYPNSAKRPEAERQIERIEEWFATKDYEIGMHYYRRKAPDSAIIYFRDVVAKYPNSRKARLAYLRLLETYRSIRYREEATEVCAKLRQIYPADSESRRACGGTGGRDSTAVAAESAATDRPAPARSDSARASRPQPR